MARGFTGGRPGPWIESTICRARRFCRLTRKWKSLVALPCDKNPILDEPKRRVVLRTIREVSEDEKVTPAETDRLTREVRDVNSSAKR